MSFQSLLFDCDCGGFRFNYYCSNSPSQIYSNTLRVRFAVILSESDLLHAVTLRVRFTVITLRVRFTAVTLQVIFTAITL